MAISAPLARALARIGRSRAPYSLCALAEPLADSGRGGRWRHVVRGAARCDREAAAAEIVFLHRHRLEAVARQQREQCRFGEVADVLLPQDREVARRRAGCEIRHVDEQQPIVAERDLHAVEKVLEIDDVLQHLARDDEVELAGLCDRVVTQRRADHVGIDLDAALAGDLARHQVGLDAHQNFRATFAKPVHEQAVVASDLEHGLMAREFRDGIELVDLVRLRLPAAEIVVELPVQNVGIDRLDDLGQAARATRQHLERIPVVLFVAAVPKPMRNRHLSEVDDRAQIGRMAEAAMIGHGFGSVQEKRGNIDAPGDTRRS
ncbi:hypothetical protein ACVWZZ_000510 [Bradyrhizobium sp. LM6.10]